MSHRQSQFHLELKNYPRPWNDPGNGAKIVFATPTKTVDYRVPFVGGGVLCQSTDEINERHLIGRSRGVFRPLKVQNCDKWVPLMRN